GMRARLSRALYLPYNVVGTFTVARSEHHLAKLKYELLPTLLKTCVGSEDAYTRA
ncbi:Protein of unknown function, partial [Gryllus bimaculatus]